MQTIFLPLCLASASSQVTITGGTHVPWSPSYHYLDKQWLPAMQRMGTEARLTLDQAGFYPEGGGQIQALIQPAGKLQPLLHVERGVLLRIRGISAVANLDAGIARRQKLQALRRLEPICQDSKIETLTLQGRTKGTFLLLVAEFEKSQAVYSSLGAPGKPAEQVADEAVDQLLEFLDSDGALDPFLADQLLLPLSFASGPSTIRTSKVTPHLLTNAEIIRTFLPVKITIAGDLGQAATIHIDPDSFESRA